jgi:maleamate amidohydrolase
VSAAADPLAAAVRERLACERARLAEQGLGSRSGPGRCPALLVIDLVRGFTDPRSPLGADLGATVAASARLVRAARDAGTPTIFSVPLAEEGGWSRKIPANDALRPGSRWVELDPRLGVGANDVVLPKTYPSCFFGTDLTTRLLSRGVDTLVIAGASTSGCVRATAVDACSLGLRTIIAGDAVGDRSALSHEVALFDLDLKYADVVGTEEAVATLAAGAAAAP